ncbi:hypothetical protein ACIP79_00655 [Streptomyces sp. NPDC088747]|uniref:hypothetical protein n=1 Tax=Streptomyces sp. NPDC088747 TaxID=3365886 RepID=UPI003814BB2B
MKCNATLTDSRKGVTYTCELGATHYDRDIQPDFDAPLESRNPGGWHKRGTEVWADHAHGATPHEPEAVSADVLPGYKASIRFGSQSGPNLDWESPYEITIVGPAAFVARVVASVADAFEEDAQR